MDLKMIDCRDVVMEHLKFSIQFFLETAFIRLLFGRFFVFHKAKGKVYLENITIISTIWRSWE